MEGIFETVDMTQFQIEQLNADRLAGIKEIKVCKEALASGITHYFSERGSRYRRFGERLSIDTEILRAIDKELLRRQNG